MALELSACCLPENLIMQDGRVETGLGSQIAELISDAGCCPHLGRFSPRHFLKRQRPQVTRPVATRTDVQAFLQQVRHARVWEAAMQRNASYVQVYKHLHRLSTHHLGVNMQNAAECIYTFVDRDTCQLQLAFRWAPPAHNNLLAGCTLLGRRCTARPHCLQAGGGSALLGSAGAHRLQRAACK